jgi:hypothetical protein
MDGLINAARPDVKRAAFDKDESTKLKAVCLRQSAKLKAQRDCMRLEGAVFRAIVFSDKCGFRPLTHRKQGELFLTFDL